MTDGSFRVYDRRAISVGGAGRTLSDTAKSIVKLEALFVVPDRFWAGRELYDPRCG